jgi:hypothetical protein
MHLKIVSVSFRDFSSNFFVKKQIYFKNTASFDTHEAHIVNKMVYPDGAFLLFLCSLFLIF